MKNDHLQRLNGTVTDVFAHRFVVATEAGRVLADLGPKGLARIELREGDVVEFLGETKPSEIKVHEITRSGEEPIALDHDKKKPEPAADPAVWERTARDEGLTVLAEPRRKAHHVELFGRDRSGRLMEFHVEFDGRVRKTKPVEAGDAKWAASA